MSTNRLLPGPVCAVKAVSPPSRVTRACLILLLASACGGDKVPPSPSAPSRAPAALTITTLTGSLTYSGTEKRYSVRVTVRETGGQTGATLGAVELTFLADSNSLGTVRFDDAWTNARLIAGSTLEAKAMTVTDDQTDRQAATRLSARISYTDDAQNAGAATLSADITQPAPPGSVLNLVEK